MSGQALGWVFDDSPMKGATFLVHLALADVANDLHDHELWCSTTTIAKKCRLSRFQVTKSLAALCDAGLVELLEERPGRTNRYRFVLPAPVVPTHRSRFQPATEVGGSSSEPANDDHGGVTDVGGTCQPESHELKHLEDERSFEPTSNFEYLEHEPNPEALAALRDRFKQRSDLA